MTRRLTFIFLCEGTSDEPLVNHLEAICVRAGAEEATGVARAGRPGIRSTRAKLDEVVASGQKFDFIVVHRDADDPSTEQRVVEVESALGELGLIGCPVVPVRATEAWLLTDEAAIRSVVGNPSGRDPLGLPRPSHTEAVADPKETLKSALLVASRSRGRRRAAEVRQFPARRRMLIERLDIDGSVAGLVSWQAMVSAVEAVVHAQLES